MSARAGGGGHLMSDYPMVQVRGDGGQGGGKDGEDIYDCKEAGGGGASHEHCPMWCK